MNFLLSAATVFAIFLYMVFDVFLKRVKRLSEGSVTPIRSNTTLLALPVGSPIAGPE